MTVEFNFMVSDVDAANIIDIMRSAIRRNNDLVIQHLEQGNHTDVLYLKRDSQYIQSLIDQMKYVKQ